jgi:hypothetical protein
MENNNKNILRPNQRRSAIYRPPPDKLLSFKFPIKGDRLLDERFNERKVKLINPKIFRTLSTGFKKEDQFVGTLKIF